MQVEMDNQSVNSYDLAIESMEKTSIKGNQRKLVR